MPPAYPRFPPVAKAATPGNCRRQESVSGSGELSATTTFDGLFPGLKPEALQQPTHVRAILVGHHYCGNIGVFVDGGEPIGRGPGPMHCSGNGFRRTLRRGSRLTVGTVSAELQVGFRSLDNVPFGKPSGFHGQPPSPFKAQVAYLDRSPPYVAGEKVDNSPKSKQNFGPSKLPIVPDPEFLAWFTQADHQDVHPRGPDVCT